MLAVEGQPPDTAGWAIEMKWDGARAIALCESGQCRLYNRNRHDVTDSYPELAYALATLSGSRQLVVDGEIVAQTASGTPSSGLLQARMHVTRPTNELIRTVPVQLYLFDLLSANGESTMAMPYLARRRRLDDLELSGPLVMVPPFWVDLEADRVMAMAREHHREGIMSKQTTSIYQSGRRSPAWIKSPFWKTTEAVIAGWMPGTRMTAATFGSLVLGAYDNAGRLVYIGNVGTGFTMATRRQLRTELDSLTQPNSPFDIQPPRPALVLHTGSGPDWSVMSNTESSPVTGYTTPAGAASEPTRIPSRSVYHFDVMHYRAMRFNCRRAPRRLRLRRKRRRICLRSSLHGGRPSSEETTTRPDAANEVFAESLVKQIRIALLDQFDSSGESNRADPARPHPV